jgi:NhaP-type Na+/H+ or K+/H+ antiporter
MVDVAFIILFALVGNIIFKKIGLPGILGMIVAGIILGPSVLDLIDPEIQAVLKEFKTIALIVILFRAGLGIDRDTLNRIGGPSIRMGFIPVIIEGAAITAVSYWLLDLPLYAAGMLGFIIAAVSPAVVVPSMLALRENGFGKKKGIPTLILAGASVDDIIAITIFGVFASLAAGAATNWTYVFLSVPAGILAGAGIGVIIGYFSVWFFKKYHIRDTMKVIIFMIVAVIFYDTAELPAIKNFIPIAALLGVMAIGFILLEKYDVLANRMAAKFNKIWVLAEILLFVYIGTEVQISKIDHSLIGVGLVILLLGLIARSIGVWISLLGSDLTIKEKLFCMIAYWPKATVQAAMGAVPLTMIMSGQINSLSEDIGQVILAMAVLSIVVTAPLGAIGIKLTGPKLLKKES